MLQTEKSTDKNLVGLQPKEPFHKQYLRVEDGPRRVWRAPNFYDLKFGAEPEKLGVRGGWLCDEMGMGKTCVCTALILANPFDPDAKPDVKPTLSGVGASASGGKRSKLTVVVCPNTLVLQWHDEVAKFGPQLKVAMLYNSHKAKALRELKSLDVLITTPHMGIPDYLGGRIHRLILDESHLYEHGSGDSMSGKRDHLLQWNPSTIWCVTGTPFATGLNQLTGQSKMMGMWYDGPKIKELTESYPRMKNEKVVEKLRSLMIRHTKSQHIAGAVALSLPDTDSKTVELELSEDEKALYAYASCSDGVPEWATAEYSIKGQNARLATLSGLTRRLMAAACLHISPEDDVEARRLASDPTSPSSVKAAFEKAKTAYSNLMRRDDDDDDDSAVVGFMSGTGGGGGSKKDAGLGVPRLEKSTKYKALLQDLDALRASDPDVSVVCFTNFTAVHSALTELLKKRGDYTVYSVSKDTPPATRQRLIKEFQTQPKVAAAAKASAAKSKKAKTTKAVEAEEDGQQQQEEESSSDAGAASASGAVAGAADAGVHAGAADAAGGALGAAAAAPEAAQEAADKEMEGADAAAEAGGASSEVAAAPALGAGRSRRERKVVNYARLDDDDGDDEVVEVIPRTKSKAPSSSRAVGGKKPAAKIFVCTYDVCAVGVTLTQASRVYLLDVSLDPAQEAQAVRAARSAFRGSSTALVARHPHVAARTHAPTASSLSLSHVRLYLTPGSTRAGGAHPPSRPV